MREIQHDERDEAALLSFAIPRVHRRVSAAVVADFRHKIFIAVRFK